MNRRPVLALVGMRGAGKTTVGIELARLVERPFVDLDEGTLRFARYAGHPAATITELFAAVGEAWFREQEAFALRQILEPCVSCVLATGGGTPERGDNRTWLRRTAFVVWLDAGEETLRQRIEASPGTRPGLTGDDPSAEVALLRARRAPLYAGLSQLRLATDEGGGDPADLARTIRDAWEA